MVGDGGGREVHDPVGDQGGDGVRAVAAGVHPHRPADRARHPHGPLEAGEARRGRPSGQGRQRQPGAGPNVGDVDLQDAKPAPEGDRQAGEPGVGHQQIGAVAHHQHRHVQAVEGPGHRQQGGLVVGFGAERGGAPDPVGRAAAQGASRVAADRAGRPGWRDRWSDSRGGPGGMSSSSGPDGMPAVDGVTRQVGDELVGQRGEVARSEREAQVTRTQDPGHLGDEVGPARHVVQLEVGPGPRTASTTSRPDTPGRAPRRRRRRR